MRAAFAQIPLNGWRFTPGLGTLAGPSSRRFRHVPSIPLPWNQGSPCCIWMGKVVEKHVKAIVSGIKPVIHSLYFFVGCPLQLLEKQKSKWFAWLLKWARSIPRWKNRKSTQWLFSFIRCPDKSSHLPASAIAGPKPCDNGLGWAGRAP